MLLKHWLTSLQQRFRLVSRHTRRKSSLAFDSLKRRIPAQTEILEDRTLLTDFLVTTLVDEPFGGGETNMDGDGTGLSLREAIGLANANGGTPGVTGEDDGDTISFDPAIAGGTIILDAGIGELLISDDLSIDGAVFESKMTISGGGQIRIFRIDTASAPGDIAVQLLNLNLTEGSTSGSTGDDGGAILVTDGENVTLDGVTITNSTAALNGGAIAAGNGTLTINNSQIGDAILGNDVWSNTGATTSDTVFAFVDTQNSTTGTAVTLNIGNNNEGLAQPINSVAAGVEVIQAGDVQYIVSGIFGEVTPYEIYTSVVDSTAAQAETETAGMDGANDTAANADNVSDGIMEERLITGEIGTTADQDFFAFALGAGERLVAIVDNDPEDDTTVTDTIVDIISTDGTTILATGIFQGSEADAAIAFEDLSEMPLAAGTYYVRVRGNSMATGTYSFVAKIVGASDQVAETEPNDTTATADLLSDSQFGQGNLAFLGANQAQNGGGIYVNAGTLDLDFTVVANNIATGPVADQGGGGIYSLNGNVTIENGSSVEFNIANGTSGSGGGIFANGGMLTIDSSFVEGNTANRAGGGLETRSILNSVNVLITDSSFIENVVIGGNTQAPGNGGGLHITAPSGAMATTVTITGGNFTGNSAGAEGGGLWNDVAGNLAINGVNINDNIASGTASDQGGGGIFNNGGTITIQNNMTTATTISGNIADGTIGGSGGGILNDGGTLTITGATISNNIANRAGGGIEATTMNSRNSVITLNDVDILNNTALGGNTAGPGNGGGVHITDAEDGVTSTFSITDSVVMGNSAAAEGGGLWNAIGGTMNIDATLVSTNIASGNASNEGGGGIFNDGGIVNITDAATIITANVANGSAGSGGGILNDGGTLNITGATINLNVANRAGGGIEATANSRSSTVTLNDVDILGNDALGGSSAAPGNGGGVHITDSSTTEGGTSTFTITGGIVGANSAAQEGGGLWNDLGGTMNIRGTLILFNTASGGSTAQGGGGIFNNGGIVTIQNNITTATIIQNNVAGASTGSGGGILNDGGTLTVTGAVINNNEAAVGGGIEATTANRPSNVTLTRTTVNGNRADDGAGIHITDATGGDASTFTVNRGTIAGNTAARAGGGLWNDVGGTLTINGTSITGNTANGTASNQGGGGIYNNGGNVTIQNSVSITTISNNVANSGSGSGGGILNNGGTLTMTGGTIVGNTAQRAGGGIEASADNGVNSVVMLTNVNIMNNVAGPGPGNGGGVHVSDTSTVDAGTSAFTITGGIVSGNSASAEGGGLWNGLGGVMNIDGVLIEANTASGDSSNQGGGGVFNDGGVVNITSDSGTTLISGNIANGSAGSGGGILNDGGTLNVTGAEIDGNAANRAGGGIEANADTRGSVVNIVNSTISNNQTGTNPGNGGGVHITDDNGTFVSNFTITGSLVTGNSASSEGGGLWNDAFGTMNVVGTTISGNTASGAEATNGGGGIFNNGGTLVVTQSATQASTISNNVADGAAGSGGGILNDGGTLTMSGTRISFNTAMRAGGGIEATTANMRDSVISITTSEISNNTAGSAPGNGGGVHISDAPDDEKSTFTIDSTSVFGNTAASEGGGLWNDAGGTMVVRASVFSNTASGADSTNGGGGIFNNGGVVLVSGGAAIFNNVANGASGSGGGIFNDGGTFTMTGGAILGNSANRAGGGVEDNAGSSLILANVIINNNVATGAGAGPGNGGALHMTGAGNVLILGGQITGNSAASEGGGLWNSSSGTLVVTGNVTGPIANPGPFIDEATGANAAAIQATVDTFRATLDPLNANEPGSVGIGRREINWDGVPDSAASPNSFPADFFNTATSGRARGVVFSTPGSGFQVSATTASTQPVEFDNINNTYSDDFGVFSPERLFTPIGSNVTVVDFFVPGTSTPAVVSAFGAVFTDVDLSGSTRMEFFDADGNLLISQVVMPAAGDENLSFTGVSFLLPVIAQVRITTGNAALGATAMDGGATDLVVMDDFIYGEPVPIPLMNPLISNNIAGGTAGSNGGGGIFNDGGQVTLNAVTLSGNSAASNGGGIFNESNGTVEIFQTTISGNNRATGDGGGVFNSTSGSVFIDDSTVSGNSAASEGGGFYNRGTLELSQVTVSANTATVNGGGIYTEDPGVLDVRNSTIANNLVTSGNAAGGVRVESGDAYFESTIVANNLQGTTRSDIRGTVLSTSQFNLVGVNTGLTGITNNVNNNLIGTPTVFIDPQLLPLANNGGPTLTHSLAQTSPAINRGSNPDNLDFDQRGEGFPRTVGVQTDIGAVEIPFILTAVGSGIGKDTVRIFNSLTGAQLAEITPYPGFTGEIRVAVGDVNGDGTLDVITAPGPGGGPHIKVFSGASNNFMTVIRDFFALDKMFTGGLFIAAANFNPGVDNNADIIVGADAGGGPNVIVYSGADPTGETELQNFFAYGLGFGGGVRVAAGDITGDGIPDIITGAGPGGGPHVRVFNGATPQFVVGVANDIGGPAGSFFAYENFTGGVYVASGDINGDTRDDIITGPGAPGGPNVRVFSGVDGTMFLNFLAYDASFTGGVRVGSTRGPDGNTQDDIITGPGSPGGPNLRIFSASGVSGPVPNLITDTLVYEASFGGGIFVAGGTPDPLRDLDGLPLQFGGGESSGDTTPLTQSQAEAMRQAAVARLAAEGASASVVRELSSIDVYVRNLQEGVLGLALSGAIVIDVNASGAGWFIDATPLDDSEFDAGLNAIEPAAMGRVDLLTVLLHELGHHLGAEDASVLDHPERLMAESLPTGRRRLPEGDLDALFADGELLDSVLS